MKGVRTGVWKGWNEAGELVATGTWDGKPWNGSFLEGGVVIRYKDGERLTPYPDY